MSACTDFINDLENGWDFAIERVQKTDDEEIKLLCEMYWQAYKALGIIPNTSDCDTGICFTIRRFVINTIIDKLGG